MLYSDSTSGVAGHPHELRHRRLGQVIQRLDPPPEFIAFPGDAVDDGADARQWQHWWTEEMAWLGDIPLYPSTSNHLCYDDQSVELFRKFHPDLPQNGPDGLEGLSYYARNGNLLYVSLHQPDRPNSISAAPADGSRSQQPWLEHVLTANRDADFKFVVGHYPALPVNGYDMAPTWCLFPAEADELWETLSRHQVDAYLCSHVIAFDFRLRDGIPQITSGGGGTLYGPNGAMPGPVEYPHITQIAVDQGGLRLVTLDLDGDARERVTWPARHRPLRDSWTSALDSTEPRLLSMAIPPRSTGDWLFRTKDEDLTIVEAPDDRLWVGINLARSELEVRLQLDSVGLQRWTGPAVSLDEGAAIEVAFLEGLGPGGVMYRTPRQSGWTSMTTTSASGIEAMTWPSEFLFPESDIRVEFR